MEINKSYKELIKIKTFDERIKYLMLHSKPFDKTFGEYRYYNQKFYSSKEWRDLRSYIISRDFGCDLSFEEYEIQGKIIIHHINPISINDIINRSKKLLSPDNLVSTSFNTHNIIHYGYSSENNFENERYSGDTCPWK